MAAVTESDADVIATQVSDAGDALQIRAPFALRGQIGGADTGGNRTTMGAVKSTTIRAADIGEARERSQASAEAIKQIGERVFMRMNPAHRTVHATLARREVDHFYVRDTVGTLPIKLADVAINRSRLYIQGVSLGVGASTLVVDWGNAYSQEMYELGTERYAAVVKAHSKTSRRQFFQDVAAQVSVPALGRESRFDSPGTLANRIAAAAFDSRLAVLIIDHVEKATGDVLEAIVELMEATDPTYQIRRGVAYRNSQRAGVAAPAAPPRLGFVLVSHEPPWVVCAENPQLLLQLSGRWELLRKYMTAAQVGQAMQQAGIGLDDWNETNEEDLAMAQRVLDLTDGQVARMAPLFEVIDGVTRANGETRPRLLHVEAAVPSQRMLVRLVPLQDAHESYPAWDTVAVDARRGGRVESEESRGVSREKYASDGVEQTRGRKTNVARKVVGKTSAAEGKKTKSGPAAHLGHANRRRRARATKEIARRDAAKDGANGERKAIKRRKHVNL